MTHQNPLSCNALHIFRAILRETTYHPDPNARFFLRAYARDSFRHNAQKASDVFPAWEKVAVARRQTALLKRARNFQRTLERANQGYLDPFRKTLDWTYARKGPRRWHLMHGLMAEGANPELQSSTPLKALPVSETAGGGASDIPPLVVTITRFSRDWKPPTLFRALEKSQAATASYIPSQSKRLKPAGPSINPTTIWGRPTPGARIRKAKKQWYAHEASTLYPPLSTKEWERIHALAAGNDALKPVRRRPIASARVFADEEPAITTPAESPHDSLLAAPQKLGPWGHGRRGRPHALTPRFLRREYAWLLKHVPVAVAPAGDVEAAKQVPVFLWDSVRAGSAVQVEEVEGKVKEAMFG